jgi:hypothetical protein
MRCPTNTAKEHTKNPSKRNRLSELGAIWCQKFTWCRTEARLLVLSAVAAAVLNSSHFPANWVVRCHQDEVNQRVRAHHAKVEGMIQASIRGAPETYNDVLRLLRRVPSDEGASTVLRQWVLVLQIEGKPQEFVEACAFGGLTAHIRLHADMPPIPNCWHEPDVWGHLCSYSWPYYLLWTHIIPIIAHLSRPGSQTAEVGIKLVKQTVKDIQCIQSTKKALLTIWSSISTADARCLKQSSTAPWSKREKCQDGLMCTVWGCHQNKSVP